MSKLSPNFPKTQLLATIVGPSVGCGLCLGIALGVLDRQYPPTQLQLVSFEIDMLLSGMAMYIALRSYKKVLRLLP